ncbi:MAG: DNA integrity scanning diadenylate cyclase DisA [Acidimicrobiales bacterium]
MDKRIDSVFVAALRQVAPGSPLRAGLDRIVQARMGALVVLGDSAEVLAICSGGFLVDAEFSPQRLYELAKMDGAIVLSRDGSRIARANVHLVPDPRVPTSETGTRHRTAERVARSIDVPVVALSEELAVITVYRGDYKRQLRSIPAVLSRADQALSTLERYKERLDSVMSTLNSLELRHEAKFKDVLLVLQRAEMVRRISDEIEWYLIELGDDGRLLALQLDELSLDIRGDYESVVTDFLGPCTEVDVRRIMDFLGSLTTEQLLDTKLIAQGVSSLTSCADLVGITSPSESLQASIRSKGKRILAQVPHIPVDVQDRILSRFSSLEELMNVSEFDLARVDGVGDNWARAIKEWLVAEA